MHAKKLILDFVKDPQNYNFGENSFSIKEAILPNGEEIDYMSDDDDDDEDNFRSSFQQHPRLMTKIKRSTIVRHHQKEALSAIVDHQGEHDISLVVLPTGAGKSAIALLAPYVLGVRNVVVITPSAIITKQLVSLYGGQDKLFDHLFPNKQRLEMPKSVLKAVDLPKTIESYKLVIVNAQKFGTVSSVDIADVPNDVDLVIVDEAHHYPAETWDNIVNHFCYSKKLFLTATPYNRNKYIVPHKYIAYQKLSRQELVTQGVLRPLVFTPCGLTTDTGDYFITLGNTMKEILDQHDELDSTVVHQGMILTLTILEANNIAEQLNYIKKDTAVAYVGKAKESVLDSFTSGRYRIIIVCGKLLEGFDRPAVSVVGIYRNVQPSSRVLFSQFVGRCVRKAHPDDPVTAHVVAHVKFNQRPNFDQLDVLATEDPKEDEVVTKEI